MAGKITVFALLDKPRSLFSITTAQLFTLIHRPLRWLRYVSYCILGLEGELNRTTDGEPVEDYDATDGLLDKYYFKPAGSLPSISELIVDPFAARSYHMHSSCSSTLSLSEKTFKDSVLARDGQRCLFTDTSANVVSHLIPYKKGDQYVDMLTTSRAAAQYAEGDPRRQSSRVAHIDDVRNGIVVAFSIHCHLYCMSDDMEGSSALLLTPNFAMGTADVPASPDVFGAEAPEARVPPERLTLQYIRGRELAVPCDGIHNRDAQLACSLQSDNAPSRIILDYMYGVTVLRALGDPQFIAYAGANHPLPALAAENAKVIERRRAEREEARRVDALDESAAPPEQDWNTRVEDAVAGLWFAASHPDRLAMMKREEAEEKAKRSAISAWAQQCAEAQEDDGESEEREGFS